MNATSIDDPETAELRAEIRRLRAEIARLNKQVGELDALAHQDSLIPVPNRRGFRRELDRLIARVQRYGDEAAVLYVDVDDLKLINDRFGHRVGDEALRCISQVLSDGLRKSDFVGRIGGDEFGILLESADLPKAQEIADRLHESITECEFRQAGQKIALSVAIGIGLIDVNDSAEDVLSRADAEMYRCKAAAA